MSTLDQSYDSFVAPIQVVFILTVAEQFTLDHVDGNKYIISIDGRSVGERWDGELILEPHDADASREWKIVPSGDEGHRLVFLDW